MSLLHRMSLRQLIANFRNEYITQGIDPAKMADDPVVEFESWLNEAVAAKLPEPNLVHLSTADVNGRPSGRVVLLKGFDGSGFVFFTNYLSRKGLELDSNPYAAITFLWLPLVRQVRIEGEVTRVSAEESETYFSSRPRKSQISAWASNQSSKMSNRIEFESHFHQAEARFRGIPVARPPHWGGYRLYPTQIEFWQGRAGRMHDRVLYTRYGQNWEKNRLFP